MKEFIQAFINAQKEMKSALKKEENPFFKSKYADLAAIDHACRFALNKNSIGISQTIQFEGEIDFIQTDLMHTSGQIHSSRCRILNPKKDPQGFGSAVSYMRRYSLAAICGVVTEDDDAESAEQSSRALPLENSKIKQHNPEGSGSLLVDLPSQKNGSPHFHTGKTFQMLHHEFRKDSKTSKLEDQVNYYLENTWRDREGKIEAFIAAAEAFIHSSKRNDPSEPPPMTDNDLNYPNPFARVK